jgi:hypothetical protein
MKHNISSVVQLNNFKIDDIDGLANNLINLDDMDLMKHLIV